MLEPQSSIQTRPDETKTPSAFYPMLRTETYVTKTVRTDIANANLTQYRTSVCASPPHTPPMATSCPSKKSASSKSLACPAASLPSCMPLSQSMSTSASRAASRASRRDLGCAIWRVGGGGLGQRADGHVLLARDLQRDIEDEVAPAETQTRG